MKGQMLNTNKKMEQPMLTITDYQLRSVDIKEEGFRWCIRLSFWKLINSYEFVAIINAK